MSELNPEQQGGNTPSEYKTISVRGVGFAPTKTADLVKAPDGDRPGRRENARAIDRVRAKQDRYAVALRAIVEMSSDASATRMRRVAEEALAESQSNPIPVEQTIGTNSAEATVSEISPEQLGEDTAHAYRSLVPLFLERDAFRLGKSHSIDYEWPRHLTHFHLGWWTLTMYDPDRAVFDQPIDIPTN